MNYIMLGTNNDSSLIDFDFDFFLTNCLPRKSLSLSNPIPKSLIKKEFVNWFFTIFKLFKLSNFLIKSVFSECK